MEMLLVLVSSPHLADQVTVFAAVRDLLLYLMGFQQGMGSGWNCDLII